MNIKKQIEETVAQLRSQHMLVTDDPSRKLAIYENLDGDVVMLVFEDGRWSTTTLDLEEVDKAIVMLKRARRAAKPFAQDKAAAYAAYEVIQRASAASVGGKA